MIPHNKLEDRLKALKEQFQQGQAQLHAIAGAMQLLEQLIKESTEAQEDLESKEEA